MRCISRTPLQKNLTVRSVPAARFTYTQRKVKRVLSLWPLVIRQAHVHGQPAQRRTRRPGAAGIGFRSFTHKGQTESGPTGHGRAASAEALEDQRQLRIGDTRPIVGDHELDGAIHTRQHHLDAGRGIEARIAQQLVNDARHRTGIDNANAVCRKR